MQWRYVKGTDNNFKVYEDGTVERLYFETTDSLGRTLRKYPKILKHNSTDGKMKYKRVNLTSYRRDYVHRIVAENFLDTPENFKELYVNHIDGNKNNNHYTNLEWCTPTENMEHASKTGLINRDSEKRKKQAPINAKKGADKRKKIANEKRRKKYGKINYFDGKGNLINTFEHIDEASLKTGKSLGIITRNILNITKTCNDKTYFRKVTD